MRKTKEHPIVLLMAAALSVSLVIHLAKSPAAATATPNARAELKTRMQDDVEKRRKEAETEARKTLDQEAIAALAETEKAIEAVAAGKREDALAAIERATGKIDVLVARHPAAALLPVRLDAEAIDLAPLDVEEISMIADATADAVEDNDYPAARALLQSLVSEIRVRSYNLPLATYPLALKDAARLLDANKPDEAAAVLLAAVNALVVVDRVAPLPVALAEEAIKEAQALRDEDKAAAKDLLELARLELERAKRLGYADDDPEYLTLNDAIENIEGQLEGGSDTASAFTALKERITSFFKRESEERKSSQVAATAGQAAGSHEEAAGD
jgi:hypothetical protein